MLPSHTVPPPLVHSLPPQVPLFKVSLDGLGAILQQYKGRYNSVIGFQPTGWNQARGEGGVGGGGSSRQQQSLKFGRRLQRGTVIVYQVCVGVSHACAYVCADEGGGARKGLNGSRKGGTVIMYQMRP